MRGGTGVTFPNLEDFRGRWRIDRVITDQKAQTTAHFEGVATFTADDDGLAYVETGQLRLAGQPPLHAERRYLWRQDQSRLHVHFDDGRFFHSIDPATSVATHWCDPDTYDVRYSFAAWPHWTSVWTVSGPRKAYEMVTHYCRADQNSR